MEISNLVLNFATQNIYGIALLLLPIYGIFWLLKRFVPRSPNPLGIVVILGFIGLSTLPSIPRYIFEKEILVKLDENKSLKLIKSAHWGAIEEPLTWFKAPIGSFYIVGPSGMLGTYYKKDSSENSFRTFLFRYEEDPVVLLVDATCKERTLHISSPDEKGVYRYLTLNEETMSDLQIKAYCEEDYTEQMNTLREQILMRTLER